ncbi:hypothetical protein FRC17_001196 [Serendipita sp. 399]|nr:hypothetical protein FRC17_001196 [Serendipita sp. 399]
MALGTTQIDESTLEVFLEEVQKYYSAEQYHLLGFNCNSFTNLCAQFLTGSSIPDTISDLPIDFISSNLGWMANPIIQALYRRTTEPMQDHGGSRLSRALRSITRLSALSSGYTGQEIKSSTSTINTQDRPSTVDGQTLYIAILQRHTGRVLAVLTIPGSAVDSTP